MLSVPSSMQPVSTSTLQRRRRGRRGKRRRWRSVKFNVLGGCVAVWTLFVLPLASDRKKGECF